MVPISRARNPCDRKIGFDTTRIFLFIYVNVKLFYNYAPLNEGIWGYGELEVYLHTFVTSTVNGSECSKAQPGFCLRGKSFKYTFNKRLSGPQSRSGRLGRENICHVHSLLAFSGG